MPRPTHLIASGAAALVLAAAPIGGCGLLLISVVAVDVAIVLFIAKLIAHRRKAADPTVVALDGTVPIGLRRRTEPALRSRRPAGVIEMQVRWRQAVEAHRRTRHGG